MRLHQKQGKLAFDVPGGWSRAELDRYAATCLKRKDTGRKVDQQDAAALELARQRKKYELDCLKVEKAQAELEAEREGHLSRDEVGRMLVARGALFSNLVFAMVQERIDQSVIIMAGSRMHHHPLGLVHHKQVRIFVYDIQGDVLCFDGEHFRIRQFHFHLIPGMKAKGRFYDTSAHAHHPVLDQLLKGTPRTFGQKRGQETVQPFLFLLFTCHETAGRH